MEREKKYSEESFWLRTVNLRENFTEHKFTNLYEVQHAIHKIYSLALENNLGQDIISEWQQNVILVQSLLDTLVPNPIRPMAGTCHYCQLPGHYARECPTMRPFPSHFGPPMMEPF